MMVAHINGNAPTGVTVRSAIQSTSYNANIQCGLTNFNRMEAAVSADRPDSPKADIHELMAKAAIIDPRLSATASSGNSFMKAALDLVKLGFTVFPCDAKVPLTQHGCKDASSDTSQVSKWWNNYPTANVGIATGGASGICVIDVDNKDGKKGSAALEELEAKHGKLPESYTIKTPTGGYHFYYRSKSVMKNSADKLGSGLDIRGDGGYVIGAGSSIGGVKYELVKDRPISDLPDWVVELLEPPRQKEKTERRSVSGVIATPSEENVDSALDSIDPDCGYDSWFRIGMALKSWNEEEGLKLWDEWSSDGSKYKNGQCESKWGTFKADGGITIATLFALAMDEGWKAETIKSMTKPMLILPTTTATSTESYRSISDCAKEVSGIFSRELTLFVRGDVFVETAEGKSCSGENPLVLSAVDEEGFRSRLDSHFTPMVYRMSGKGDGAPRLMANNCSADMAKSMMAAKEMKAGLPPITGVIRAPLLLPDGRVLRKGYDRSSGWFISGGAIVEGVSLETAVETLKSLVSGFNFQTPGDRSRALGSFFLPALRFGRFFTRVPLDVAEADRSQSGKTYRQDVVAAAYGEETFKMSRKDGGVGGLDESFASRLFQGRAFIQFDNIRNKLDSQYLEAYMTASGMTFGVRVPYHGEADIDPAGSCVFLSSNGVETTPDLANRSVIVRIRKQPEGYVYPTFAGLGLLEYVREKQGFVLGCIHAILKEWMNRGCLKTTESRHDFREWCQSMDWIVQNIFNDSPLMDGHQEAKERVSDPNKTFLRNICILVERLGKCGQDLKAGDIYSLAEENDIKIPGLHTLTEDAGRKRIGVIVKSAGLKDSPTVIVDGYTISRTEQQVRRDDGTGYFQMSVYKFSPYGEISTPQPPQEA